MTNEEQAVVDAAIKFANFLAQGNAVLSPLMQLQVDPIIDSAVALVRAETARADLMEDHAIARADMLKRQDGGLPPFKSHSRKAPEEGPRITLGGALLG